MLAGPLPESHMEHVIVLEDGRNADIAWKRLLLLSC